MEDQPPTKPAPSAAAESPAADSGIIPQAAEWASDMANRLLAGIDLVMAETRLAVSSFVLMLFLVILAALSVMFGWGLLMIALAQFLAANGLNMVTASALLGVIHFGLALGLWLFARRLWQHMEFRATRELMGS